MDFLDELLEKKEKRGNNQNYKISKYYWERKKKKQREKMKYKKTVHIQAFQLSIGLKKYGFHTKMK